MPKVVRVSYFSKKENKKKWLQTKVERHGSAEKAKQYLEDKKESLLKLDDPPSDKEEDIESIETEKKSRADSGNLIERPIESSPHLDQIVQSLKYSDFNLDLDPETGGSITIFGSSKSYKTYLLKRIIKQYFSEDCIVLLCAQNIHAPIYNDLPSTVITMDHYSPLLVKVMTMINKKCKNKYRFLVILDDIIDEKSEHKLEQLYLTLRNSRMSVIVCLQNVQLLKKTSRGNSNIVIFRKFNQDAAIEGYAMKEYLKNFPPFKDLKMDDKITLYRQITNKHDFFVLDVLNNTLILCKELDIDK